MKQRKGIYQSHDASGYVTADERWRIAVPDSGLMAIESEITRIAPFAEPRVESFTLQLSRQYDWQSLGLYTRSSRREASVRFDHTEARFCWRHDQSSQQRVFSWQNDSQIGYNSPLFSMVTLWRSRLTAGEIRSFETIVLDSLTFEPARIRQSCCHRGTELRHGLFGTLELQHYELISGAGQSSHVWCDHDAVIHEFTDPYGSGFILKAVNLPT